LWCGLSVPRGHILRRPRSGLRTQRLSRHAPEWAAHIWAGLGERLNAGRDRLDVD